MMIRSATRGRDVRLRPLVVACLAALAVAAPAVVSPPRADATSYRYWSYWTGGSSWKYATQGAARVPPDGSVDGWRFAVNPASGSATPPRGPAGFDALCGHTEPVEGKKRVAIVIDYGTGADAPPGDQPPAGPVGDCVVLPTSANGYQLLAAVTAMRVESGLVCGITGYPQTGCAEPVAPEDEPTRSSTPEPTRSNGGGGAGPTSTSDDGPQTSTSDTGGSVTPSSKPPKSRGNDGGRSPDPATSATASVTTADAPSPLAAPDQGTDASGGGPPLGLLAGAVVLAGLAVAGYLASRRRA